MENLNALNIFVGVGETRSFSRAADRLGITASGVSKGIHRLESELGVRLLNRTTRRVSLTPEGEQFLARCQRILDEVREAENAVTRARAAPKGRLRVQLSVGFGRHVVVPLLARFTEKYSDVVVDAELSDRIVNFGESGLDVAVHGSDYIDPRLVARKLCFVQYVLCASPAYLRKYGEPATPAALDQHRCIAHLLPRTGRYREWVFTRGGEEIRKTVAGSLNFNNAESALDAAIAGAGIAMLGAFVVADAVAAGKLSVVLEDYAIVRPSVSVIYPPNGFVSERVRVFVDFLRRNIPMNLSLESCLDKVKLPRAGLRLPGGRFGVC